MPLPRPIGDPFVVKDEPQPPMTSSSSSMNGKRPISASAFSFSLGPKSTPKRTKLEPISAGISLSKGKQSGEEGKKEMDTPIRDQHQMTPMKTNLDSLPSYTPLNKRLNDSPHALHPLQTPQNRKRISDSSFSIPHKRVKEEKEEKPLISLGSIGKVEFDSIHVEAVKKRVEEEGLGPNPTFVRIEQRTQFPTFLPCPLLRLSPEYTLSHSYTSKNVDRSANNQASDQDGAGGSQSNRGGGRKDRVEYNVSLRGHQRGFGVEGDGGPSASAV